MAKITAKGAISGILVLAAVLFVGYGVKKALDRPGPKQIGKVKETREALERIEKWERKAEKLKKSLERLAIFVPPSDGIVPRERMNSYVAVHDYVHSIEKHLHDQRPKELPDLGGALFIAKKEMAILNKVRREKLLEYNMTPEEYLWIRDKIRKAVALAIKRMAEYCYGPDKPDYLIEFLKQAAKNAGIYDKTEDGNIIPRPGKIDPSVIPEIHYKYVLEYWPWLHPWRIDKRKLNIECLMERENIQPAAFTPLKVEEYPDI